MINIPIWAFVLLCIFGFIGALVLLVFLLGLILIVVDAILRNRHIEENECPYEVEERKENNETEVL